MKKYTNEFKVGLFVILCALGLFYMSYSTGKMNIIKKGYFIYVSFNDVAGMEKKAPVMLNGLEMGKVEDIKISYDNDMTRVILKIWLEAKAKVRENPVVSIKTLGLMGEKYIQIATAQGANFIKPNTMLEGKPYSDLDALMEQAQSIAKDVTQQVNRLIGALSSTLEDNKESISQIIKNLESTSQNFEEFSSDIKRHPWKLLFKTKEKPAPKK